MAARIQSLRNGITPIDEQSRDDLVVGDVVTVSALDAATTYAWAITFAPEGSTAGFSGSVSAVSPGTFTVDLEGAYLIRLIVDAGLSSEDVQYVRLRALTVFGQLHLVAAGERRDGTGIIPVDVDTEGWANEQNANLVTLKDFIKPLVSSGRILYVDANDGTSNYADHDTVQAAINAAVAQTPSESSQWAVLVRPGRYIEDLTFAPWVHVFGWPGNLDGRTSEAVVLQGVHTANITSGQVLLGNLHLENNTNSATATLTKTGADTLRLFKCRVESNGLLANQGPAVGLSAGSLDVVQCHIVHTVAGAATRLALIQDGASILDVSHTTLLGPNCAGLNTAGVSSGVSASFTNCRFLATAGADISTRANNTTLDHCLLTGTGVYVNLAASGLAGDVRLDMYYCRMESGDISFDATGITGITTMNLGSIINPSTSILLPGGPLDFNNAYTLSKTHWYDNTTSGFVAKNVQDAIDEVAVLAATNPNDDAQFEMTVFPNNIVNTVFFAPYALTIVAIKAYATVKPVTAGVYTLSVVDIDGANNLLAAATWDMTALTAATLTTIPLTATVANLDLAEGTRVQFQLVSDNADLVTSGVYLQIIYRSQ